MAGYYGENSTAGPAEAPVTEIQMLVDRLKTVGDNVDSIQRRLNAVADQFYGPRPEAVEKDVSMPTNGGSLVGVHNVIDEIFRSLERLDSTAHRFSNLA